MSILKHENTQRKATEQRAQILLTYHTLNEGIHEKWYIYS